ncbi:MAG: ferredoxin--NADP reductase, partial [Candidatus Lutacidiplasmatales archaeon]
GMAEYAADRHLPIEVRLVYSNRNEEEIAYRPELEELTRRNPRFEVVHTLTRSREDSSWDGRRGRIDAELLREVSSKLADPVFYLCGTAGLVDESYRTLLSLGVSQDRVVHEVFRGYG